MILDGLEESAQAFYQALASAGDQRESYWRNRAQPFWQKIWPKSRELATSRIAEFLALMAISAEDEFPAALTEIKDWLKPIQHPFTVMHALQKSGLCEKFPAESLKLLSAIIVESQLPLMDLSDCLDQIVASMPDLARNLHYMNLLRYSVRRGI